MAGKRACITNRNVSAQQQIVRIIWHRNKTRWIEERKWIEELRSDSAKEVILAEEGAAASEEAEVGKENSMTAGARQSMPLRRVTV